MSRPSDERQVPVPNRDPLTWGRAEKSGGESISKLLRIAILFYLGMGLAGLIWMTLRGDFGGGDPATPAPLQEALRAIFLGPKPLFAAAVGVALGLLLVAVTRLLEGWGPIEQLLDGFANVLGRVTPLQAIVLALVSSIGEELLFRGALQPWLGLWATSAIFGVCHFPPDRQFLAWPIFAFAAGLGLGYTAEASTSLIAPIVAHFLVNWINLRYIARVAKVQAKGG